MFFTDAQGRQRAQSFAAETAPAAVGVYTWNSVRSGSFLYQSGSHPAVQVQMGLYGAVKKDFALNQAYADVNSAYDLEQILFFSEIDAGLHGAVASGTYGLPNSTYITTIDYKPRWFLVNGSQYTTAQTVVAGVGTERVLLRMYNGGIKPHTAELLGLYMTIFAEDGSAYPFPRKQYEGFMAPGQTLDAVVTRPGPGVFHVCDRFLPPGLVSSVPDLNLDGLVSRFDAAILADYLNGTIVQGDLPFIAPLSAADLNLDGLVNATDLLLLTLRVP